MDYQTLLLSVSRPGRYIGHELGQVRKEGPEVELRMALAFPDLYEVAMSHLGLHILYRVLNHQPWLACERAFAPWPDLEARLRHEGLPLCSLESGRPLSAFDVIGFSLQYELASPTMLSMLDLAGVPLRWADRRPGDPVVIAGGPCVANPAPLAPFLDALVLGDGEEVAIELAQALRPLKEAPRSEIHAALAAIDGVYVPALPQARARRRALPCLPLSLPGRPLLPQARIVHDRVIVEIQRGCTRGCRFCQAGMINRPMRQQDPQAILEQARRALQATGLEDISLLSLSAGDHPCLIPLIQALVAEHGPHRVSVALPSLRTETLTPEVVAAVKEARKTGFTLAPEAATDRLRAVINKGNREEDLLKSVETVFRAGWSLVKLYFMIGLPTETAEDVEAIADLAGRASRLARSIRRGGAIHVAVSTFVPKAHTPFQWEAMLGAEAILDRQRDLKSAFRPLKAELKMHSPFTSVMEGVLARGDSRVGEAIEGACRLGGRLDGWSEHFRRDLWLQALDEAGVDLAQALGPRPLAEPLPWEAVDMGVTMAFLAEERRRALSGEFSPDCASGPCGDCGACSPPDLVPRPAEQACLAPAAPDAPGPGERVRLRIRYAKGREVAALSHIETMTALLRALRRAGLPLAYSEGYHPKPRVDFGLALPVGATSEVELMDVELMERVEAAVAKAALEGAFPTGFRVMEASLRPLSGPSISSTVTQMRYELDLFDAQGLEGQVEAFLAAASVPFVRMSEGRAKALDLRPGVRGLALQGPTLTMDLAFGDQGSVRPRDLACSLLGRPSLEVGPGALRRVGLSLRG